jgi:ureidoglycolate hydrolase
MFKKKGELTIPPVAKEDPDAFEITRIWIAQGNQHVTIHTGIWEDPAAWGMFLVDLAKHIAIAYERDGQLDRVQVLKRIKEGFDAEWESPTDEPKPFVH